MIWSFDAAVWFFFRCVDVLVLGTLGWYLLKRQVIPSLRSRMQHDAYSYDQRERHRDERKAELLVQEQQLLAQQEDIARLKITLAQWVTARAQQVKTMQERMERLQHAQQVRVYEQVERVEYVHAVAALMKQSYEKAQKVLYDQCQQDATVQRYMHEALARLKERA